MKQRTQCPQCHSKDIDYEDYIGVSCLRCHACGYSEAEQLDITPEENTSQKEKTRYSPYKTGGSKRSRKI